MNHKTLAYFRLTYNVGNIGPETSANEQAESLFDLANRIYEELQYMATRSHTAVRVTNMQHAPVDGGTRLTVYVEGDLPDLQDHINDILAEASCNT